jgi:indolepyruvate ferredoxin oxidoreductase alpha subunit
MKHVGLNVAADAVVTLAYMGVSGGCVIVTADDPACHSSQNEQDNRFYSLLSNIPCLEPSNAQEAKDMTVSAINFSQLLKLPILLRTTTRISHTRGPVCYGSLTKPRLNSEFIRDPARMVMLPAHSRQRHHVLLEKVEKAKQIGEADPLNFILEQDSELAIISSGAAYNYAVEALNLLDLDASILKLGMIHPLPQKKIGDFLASHEKVVVVEELEPYLEMQIKGIAKDYAPHITIYGKTSSSFFPRTGELTTNTVAVGLHKITGKQLPKNFDKASRIYPTVVKNLPSRAPILCAGCPHRASFYALKRVGHANTIYSTDIGCYALGSISPLNVGDISICMGASIGTIQGINKVTKAPTIAIIGDSTFFHAAIPGLINAVYHKHNVVLAVLDNHTTAMTGHQPHPGTGITGMGESSEEIRIEKIAKGCGVKFVRVVNPFRVKETRRVLTKALNHVGPSVVVLRAPCALQVAKEKRRKDIVMATCEIGEKCTGCMACIKLLGCPALNVEAEKVSVNALCAGCGLCAAICPYNAINITVKEA